MTTSTSRRTSRSAHPGLLSASPARLAASLFCLFLCGLQVPARAQDVESAVRSSPLLVHDVAFAGNTLFSDQTLSLHVRTSDNRRFLGIPGFTWWLWLYRLGESEALGSRIGDALMSSGEPPAVLDESVVSADVERLRLFYQQEGFRDAEVNAQIDTLRGRRAVDVTFRVAPGDPTFIRRVTFDGLDVLAPRDRQALVRGSLLQPYRLDEETPLTFTVRRHRYSEPTLHEERRRLMDMLRNAGYAAVTRDSVRALVFPQAPDSFDLVFRVRPGPRYRFGDVHFEVQGPEEDAKLRTDTLHVPAPADTVAGGIVTVGIEGESQLTSSLLLRTLQFRPGTWYDQSDLLATKRRLEGTGLFVFTDIVPLLEGAGDGDFQKAPRLPHRIELRTRQRHQIRLETFMLTRSGVVGGAENELGTGVGFSYANANTFGAGETFRLSTTGSVAADMSMLFDTDADTVGAGIDEGLFTSAQGEVSASLTYPYLFSLFNRLERVLNLYDARTRISLSLLTARRADLGLLIRGRGTGRFRLEMQHSPTVTSFVDLLDVSLSNPDTLSGFRRAFFDRILDSTVVRDPVQRAQLAEDYTQPQVNTVLRYTLRSARVNPLRRERGYSYEGSVEIGNNLPYLLDRLVFTPSTLEGSLPALPVFGGDRADNRLVYRQYVRVVGDLRRYRPLGTSTVLAAKLITGIAHPIGRADVVPFDRRFFSGGGSSVRGWELRELGPGAATFSAGAAQPVGDVANILGGDVKLEAGLELRQTVLRNVLGAEWIGVAFADAGNVWFGPRNPGFGGSAPLRESGRFRFDTFYRQLGVGAGAGVRIGWEFLIVRFDLAARVYDPRQAEEGLFPDGLRALQPHFGIGHAF